MAVNVSVVFLVDASDSIGSSAFTNVKTSVASAATTLAQNGARVGVVIFSDSASVDVPLQKWGDTSNYREILKKFTILVAMLLILTLAAALVLGYDIELLHYIGSGSNTLLGNEGIRVIFLLTNGKSNDRSAAEDAAEAAKQVGISIYAGGIGDNVNEDELNSLASYPPEEYRISIEDFTETALNEGLQSLIDSTCLSKQTLYST